MGALCLVLCSTHSGSMMGALCLVLCSTHSGSMMGALCLVLCSTHVIFPRAVFARQDAVRDMAAIGDDGDSSTEVPMFGSRFPVHTSPLVGTAGRSRTLALVLKKVAHLSPGLTFAPWIVPLVAIAIHERVPPSRAAAIVIAILRGDRSGAAVCASKLDSWVATAVFEKVARRANRALVERVFTAQRYGEMLYHTDGQLTLDPSAPPVVLGSRRHPFAGVCFGWIEVMQPTALVWSLDNVMVGGHAAVLEVGFACVKTWAAATAAVLVGTATDVPTISDVVSDLGGHLSVAHSHDRHVAVGHNAQLKHWAAEVIEDCRSALEHTGRHLAATELVEPVMFTSKGVKRGESTGGCPPAALGMLQRSRVLDGKCVVQLPSALLGHHDKSSARQCMHT
jgi:hypothetical protein